MSRFREAFPILYAASVERTAAFYAEAFGFEQSYRWPAEGPPDYVFLRLESLGIGVASFAAAEQAHGGRPSAETPPRFELCIEAEDVDRAAERLRSLGARELAGPEDKPWGERVAYFSDPGRNPIHVLRPGATSGESSSRSAHATFVVLERPLWRTRRLVAGP